MNATSRLAAFAAGLAVLGGIAAAVGSATDATPPFQDCLKVAAADAGVAADAMGDEGHGGEPMVEAVPGADGLKSELAGVALNPEPSSFTAGRTTTWRFKVTDCDGKALRDFEPENGKLLHLIVVRSDLTAYQHLHPQLGAGRRLVGGHRDAARRPLPRDRRLRDRRPQVRRRHDARGSRAVCRPAAAAPRRCTRAPTATTSSFSARPSSRPARRPS